MEARLLDGDAARIDEALHERVVRRDLCELVVAVEVDARVADVSDDRVIVDHQERAHRGAEPREFGPLLDRIDQGGCRFGDRVAQLALGLGRARKGPIKAFEVTDRDR